MTAIGVQFATGDSGVAPIVEAAMAFEAAGFESAWIGDHLIDHYEPSRPVPECLVTVASVMAATNTLRVGSLMATTLARPPAYLAQAAGTLAEASGDRFELGLGTGGTRREFEALGIDFPRRRERVQHLERSLRVLRALRSGGPVTDDELGLSEAWCRPAPRSVRLIVGSLGRVTARLAGRLADEINVIDYAEGVDAEKLLGISRDAASSARRRLRVSLMVPAESETAIAGGRHPQAGLARAERLGADRLILRLLPPYPSPQQVLSAL